MDTFPHALRPFADRVQAGRALAARLLEMDITAPVTVLALPINMIAGLLGMNVGGVPLAEHPMGFWIVVAVIATFTAGAAVLALRRKRD